MDPDPDGDADPVAPARREPAVDASDPTHRIDVGESTEEPDDPPDEEGWPNRDRRRFFPWPDPFFAA